MAHKRSWLSFLGLGCCLLLPWLKNEEASTDDPFPLLCVKGGPQNGHANYTSCCKSRQSLLFASRGLFILSHEREQREQELVNLSSLPQVEASARGALWFCLGHLSASERSRRFHQK